MPGERRVYPPRDLEDLLNRITEPQQGKAFPLFETKEKALVFAAGVGLHLSQRIPVSRRGEGIRIDIFENAVDDGLINMLAVVEEDLSILAPDSLDRRVEIFEEYAHAGLLAIQKECFEKQGDPLLALVRLCQEGWRPTGDTGGIIDDEFWRDIRG